MRRIIIAAAAAIALATSINGQNCESNECTDRTIDETITMSEVGYGSLLLETMAPGRYVEAPSISSHIDVQVNGMLIRTTVTQTFTNPTGACVNAVYVFPLPEGSAVDSMKMRIGVRTIEGEIHERQQARQIFEQARSEGRKATLLEQERPDVFTLSVASLGAGETVEITIGYDDLVRYDSGIFSMRLPLVVAPRYSHAGGGIPSAPRIPGSHAQGPMITLALRLDAGATLDLVRSPSHEIDVVRTGSSTATLRLEEIPAGRDFHLDWKVALAQEPSAVVFDEQGEAPGDPSYSMIMMLPPRAAAARSVIPREQIFVLDTSGSMAGESMDQAKQALTRALDRLRGYDRFNIIEFNSGHRSYATSSKAATESEIANARKWVSRLDAEGGTNILPALVEALRDDNPFPGELRQVVFITDGLISNEDELAAVIRSSLGRSRLFTVGIGSAPNGHFMSSIARHGRGTFTWVPGAENVEQRMSTLLDKIDSPALTGVRIDLDDVTAEAYPRSVPDLYIGEPMISVVRHFDRSPVLSLTGNSGADGASKIRPIRREVTGSSLARLWARRKIDDISDQTLDGLDAESARKQIVEVAIAHHLVSAHTSLVAVDRTPTGVDAATCIAVPIPLRTPDGMILELPRTGTGAPLFRLIAILLTGLAFLIRASRRTMEGRAR